MGLCVCLCCVYSRGVTAGCWSYIPQAVDSRGCWVNTSVSHSQSHTHRATLHIPHDTRMYITSCSETHMLYCKHAHSYITAGVTSVAWKTLTGLQTAGILVGLSNQLVKHYMCCYHRSMSQSVSYDSYTADLDGCIIQLFSYLRYILHQYSACRLKCL